MRACLPRAIATAALVLCTTAALPAGANLINGDFEAGLAGWTVVDQVGGSGSWFSDAPGTTTPLSGFATSPNGGLPHGSLYAVSDQTGPGSHALIQSFTIAAGVTTAILSWDMFINDQSGAGPLGTGLDYNVFPTQIGRVDILSAAAGALDVGAGVLQTCFIGSTPSPGGVPNDFATQACDISAIVAGGGTFQLRFAETDNQSFFNMGIDNVRLATRGVPEPGSLALAGIALAGLALARRRARR